MRTLTIVPTPTPEDGQGQKESGDLRDYPLKLKLGDRPLDLMPGARFDEVRDHGLLYDLAASTPADASVSSIRRGETHRTIVSRPFFLAKNMRTAEVLAAFAARDFRPADPLEFLAFAGQYPEIQHGVPIVTLGWSRLDGRYEKYAMLTTDVRRRRILRSVCPPSWPPAWRYLIVAP